MENIEKELHGFVGRELHELAWRCNYPVHESVALYSFLEAFRANGALVQTQDKEAKITFLRELNNHPRCLDEIVSFHNIINGWGHTSPGSPRELYNSIYIIYDKMAKQVHSNEENEWDDIRNSEPRVIRRKMEDKLMEYFNRYHEHVLLHVDGKQRPFEREPKIIHEVLSDFPLYLYQHSEIRSCESDRSHLTPCAETLLDIEWDFDESYYPSESCVTEFFWGHYLHQLVKEKGYPLRDKTDNPLRCLIANGVWELKQGREIWLPAT